MTKIEIESEFNKIVPKLGGIRIDEIVGDSPVFDNADYLFSNHKTIAELKCLQENKLDDPVLMERMENLWSKWEKQGHVNGDIPERIQRDSIPDTCFQELYSLCSKSLKSVIKKANKQIRNTKNALKLSDHHGLLLLANDGNYALPPKTLLFFVAKILHHDFSEIEDFVIFSGNMLASAPDISNPCYIWLSGNTQRGPYVSPEFIEQMRIEWRKNHEAITGQCLKEFGSSIPQKFQV